MSTKIKYPQIADLRRYNAEWHGGVLKYQKICTKTDKDGNVHIRKKKDWPVTDVNVIKPDNTLRFNKRFYDEIEKQYKLTKTLPPINISLDSTILNGLEIYSICKRNKIKRVPYQQSMKILREPTADKTYSVKDINGRKLYTDLRYMKSISRLKYLCNKYSLTCDIMPDFKFNVMNQDGVFICRNTNRASEASNIITNIYESKKK